MRTEYPPPPLSRNLRAFTTPDGPAYPFGGTEASPPHAFQSVAVDKRGPFA